MNNYLKLGKGRIVGDYSKKGQKNEKWFEEFQDNEESYRAFLELSRDVLTPDGHIYIMFDSYSLLSLGPLVRDYFDIKVKTGSWTGGTVSDLSSTSITLSGTNTIAIKVLCNYR